MRNRLVAFTSSALIWSVLASCPLVSASSNGVTDPRFAAVPGAVPPCLPKLGFDLFAARSFVPLGLENNPKNTKIRTMTAAARSNRALLRSTVFAVLFCLSGCAALRPSFARRYASCSEPKTVFFSSGSAASGCSDGGTPIRSVRLCSAGSGSPSVSFTSGVILFGSLLKNADSEADRRQGGPVDGSGIGDLKQQGLIGLFEARSLEYQDAVRTLSGTDPPLAHAEILH